MASPTLLVFVAKNFACVKISGRGKFTSSPDFKVLLYELALKGYMRFVFDLSECVLMDSTFLGVLAGFAIKLAPKHTPPARLIQLLNPTPRVIDLFDNLGTLHLFEVTTGGVNHAGDAAVSTAESIHPTREQIARTSLEAHQTLMAMNPENMARFKDVARFLSEDLKNLEKASD